MYVCMYVCIYVCVCMCIRGYNSTRSHLMPPVPPFGTPTWQNNRYSLARSRFKEGHSVADGYSTGSTIEPCCLKLHRLLFRCRFGRPGLVATCISIPDMELLRASTRRNPVLRCHLLLDAQPSTLSEPKPESDSEAVPGSWITIH